MILVLLLLCEISQDTSQHLKPSALMHSAQMRRNCTVNILKCIHHHETVKLKTSLLVRIAAFATSGTFYVTALWRVLSEIRKQIMVYMCAVVLDSFLVAPAAARGNLYGITLSTVKHSSLTLVMLDWKISRKASGRGFIEKTRCRLH